MQTAIVETVIYHKEDGYTVLVLDIGNEVLKATGTIPFTLSEGQKIEIEGKIYIHPKHGRQLKITDLAINDPTTTDGIKAYLSAGILSGVGPSTAERIVKAFGEKSLKIIDSNPEALLQVKGIGVKTLKKIAASWQEKREGARIMLGLCKIGLSFALGAKIYKHYGSCAAQVIKENPYRLAEEISGIGFKRADDIAMKIGFDKQHPFRIESGVLYTLKEAQLNGHCFLPEAELKEKAKKILQVEAELIERAIEILTLHSKIISAAGEGRAVYLSSMYYAERYIEQKLSELLVNNQELQFCEEVIKKYNLEDEQANAVRTVLSSGGVVITGSAGTGKTTTLQTVIECLKKNNMTYSLCAPTGKAAKRISEVTGEDASTIHRLIGLGREAGARRDEDNPLTTDFYIIDEFSMVDTYLLKDFLKAVPHNGRLVMIGDVSQLPPVGPGLAFKDIIESGICPVVKLTKIHRQKDRSSIIDIANSIKDGKFPSVPNKGDSYFFKIDGPEKISQKIVDLAVKRIPEKFGIPFEDIQVLSPMKKGEIGVNNLNLLLQAAVHAGNGTGPSIRGFKIKDRVMQTVNDYKKEVYNGEIGYVKEIDEEAQTIRVCYDIGDVEYEFNELDEITLAYSCSVHRYQGSESRCVIVPVDTSHYIMLRKDLLYTAVTRAREMLVLIGSDKAITIAVKRKDGKAERRHTGLFKGMATC